jgi:hypothetical protein
MNFSGMQHGVNHVAREAMEGMGGYNNSNNSMMLGQHNLNNNQVGNMSMMPPGIHSPGNWYFHFFSKIEPEHFNFLAILLLNV